VNRHATLEPDHEKGRAVVQAGLLHKTVGEMPIWGKDVEQSFAAGSSPTAGVGVEEIDT
jgi:hypothetical protein